MGLIKRIFKPEIDSGFIKILTKTNGYGNLLQQDLPRFFNDPIQQVLWRSKECLDFAFSMDYARIFGDYVLFMEDDVIVAKNFTEKVMEYLEDPTIKSNSSSWLFFSLYSNYNNTQIGLIPKQFYDFDACTQGILFRSTDLSDLVDFIRYKYFQAPLDYLLRDYLRNTGKKMFYAIPNLVQHIQGFSSFQGKGQYTHKSFTFEEGDFFAT